MRFLLIFILGFTSINSYSQSDFIKNTFQGPHNLRVFHDYDIGMNYAKQINKLVLLDFNGYACVNCRKMESLVWGDQEVLKILSEKLIVISLFVDDKTKLPKADQKSISINGRKTNIVTYGNKWSVKQLIKYKTNTQPYYVMKSPDGKDLSNGSANYENYKNPNKFKAWLEEGLNETK